MTSAAGAMKASVQQEKASREVKAAALVSRVLLFIWLSVVIANLFVESQRIWDLGLVLALAVLFSRCEHLRACIALADANVRRLAEHVDGDR